jgi:gamma-glutamyl-gamma-aminobutyrate hydrolase PuuD
MLFYTEDENIANLIEVRLGHKRCNFPEKATHIFFKGGMDVNPKHYNQKPHPKTYFSDIVDNKDLNLFNSNKDAIKIGICRGGQFLNVMAGGSMWQHVDGHATGTNHEAFDLSGSAGYFTSTHHQMMRPSSEGVICLYALESTFKEDDSTDSFHQIIKMREAIDVEAIYYPKKNIFCYQPHPEYDIYSNTANWFLNFLSKNNLL